MEVGLTRLVSDLISQNCHIRNGIWRNMLTTQSFVLSISRLFISLLVTKLQVQRVTYRQALPELTQFCSPVYITVHCITFMLSLVIKDRGLKRN